MELGPDDHEGFYQLLYVDRLSAKCDLAPSEIAERLAAEGGVLVMPDEYSFPAVQRPAIPRRFLRLSFGRIASVREATQALLESLCNLWRNS